MGDDTKRTEKTEVTTEEKKNRWGTPSQPDEVTEYKKVTKKETEEKEDDDHSTIILEE